MRKREYRYYGNSGEDFLTTGKLVEILRKVDPGGKMVIVAEYPYPLGRADMKDHCKRITGIKFSKKKNACVIEKDRGRDNGFRADLLGLNFIPDFCWYF